MGKASIHADPTAHIERFSESFDDWRKCRELPKHQLVALLRQFGLDSFEIEILFDRFYDELTFGEMVKKRGWVSTGTASHAYRRVLQKLRKRGFNFP